MEKIILAYAHENAGLADQIATKLSRVGVVFDHISDGSGKLPGQFAAAVQATSAPIILLVTDNLLRSTNAMSNALPMLQQLIRTNRLITVVADGHRMNPETGQMERVETQFERVIHAIIYMNYWQSVYLELRQKKDHTLPQDSDSLDIELRAVRDISNEIGELLNALRNAEFSTFRQFSAGDYEQFFKKIGRSNLHSQYQKIAAFDDPNVDFLENMPNFFPENSISPTSIFPENYPPKTPENEILAEDFLSKNKLEKETENAQNQVLDILGASVLKQEYSPNLEESQSDVEEYLEINEEAEDGNFNPPVASNYVLNDATTPTPAELPVISFDSDFEEPKDPSILSKNGHSKSPIEVDFDFDKKATSGTPSHAEIQAMVAEIVREEQQAAFHAAAVENLDFEPNAALEKALLNQNLGSISPATSIQNYLPDEEVEDLDYDSRPVLPLQLAHFQPVSSKSSSEDDFEITLNDARFWLEKGKYDSAILQAQELLVKYPNAPEGHFLLAEIEEIQSNFEAARRHFEKTLMLDADFPFAHLRLARLLDIRFRHEKKEAVRHFKAAAKIDSTDTESTYRTAIIYLENLGKPEKARRYFQKTVDREPEHALAWFDLAHLERQLGNFDEAADAWQQAISLNPAWRTETASRLFVKKSDIESIEPIIAAQLVENQSIMVDKIAEKAAEKAPNITSKKLLTVLITGATSGIGRATAELFAQNGHRVLLTGRRQNRLDDLEKLFQQNFQNDVFTACFDIRNRAEVMNFTENLPENWQNIDILINNAGLAKGLDSIQEANLNHWDEMIDTNLKGLLYITRLISPGMVARKRGQIINIGSIAGKEVYQKGNVYNATKFAVDALTRSMRLDLVPHGIRVSSVSPGAVEETEFSLVRFDGDAKKANIYADYQPLLSKDVAETIYFIATRPSHVAIHDVVLTGAQQASATQITRSGR